MQRRSSTRRPARRSGPTLGLWLLFGLLRRRRLRGRGFGRGRRGAREENERRLDLRAVQLRAPPQLIAPHGSGRVPELTVELALALNVEIPEPQRRTVLAWASEYVEGLRYESPRLEAQLAIAQAD